MNHLIEKIKKDRIDKAVATLKGHCEKHTDCKTCRFADGKGFSMFEKSTVPCDWSVNNA